MVLSVAFHAIVFDKCANCKGCCSDTKTSGERSEIIQAYNAIELIKSGSIPVEEVKQLVLVRFPAKQLDEAARNLRMYPLTNLLNIITLPNANGEYEFLAIPPAIIGKCPFLSPTGCTQSDAKSYICAIYPFYVHKLQFRNDYECPWINDLEEDLIYREAVGHYITDFIIYSQRHQKEYFDDLQELKKKYQFREVKPTTID